ncbi:hypothetical protein BD779DRAFT_1476354 [Infundibulicybe gibba]|nr:hypothetical protein BD779DRAFT_1476354 [Infundibulicybe gibba]
MPISLSIFACHKGDLEEALPASHLSPVGGVGALNEILAQLARIFPEHSAAMIRRVLLSTSPMMGASHIAVASDELATRPPDSRGRPRVGLLESSEYFRSAEYQLAVGRVLRKEFPDASNAEIVAAVVEYNWDYGRSHAHLSRLPAKNTRFPMSLSRYWRSEVMPVSGCPELDREIAAFYHINYPGIRARHDDPAAASDEEYPFECQCCFRDVPQAERCHCSEFHNFCRECLRRHVEGIVYGHASASGLDPVRGSVRCIASGVGATCISSISPLQLAEFLEPRLLRALEERLARDAIRHAGINALSCPFCRYVVEEEVAEPPPVPEVRIDPLTHILTLLGLASRGDELPHHNESAADPWNELSDYFFGDPEASPVKPVSQRTVFRCENPECGRESCIKCKAQWVQTHDPFNCTLGAEGTSDVDGDEDCARQAFISQKMDESIKRICMKCSTAFVKDGGCNRVVCPCGQKICYVCRANLMVSDYNHFCGHFRENPGEPCKKCNKCLLYVQEDVDYVNGEAERQAMEEWENGRSHMTLVEVKSETFRRSREPRANMT